MGSFRLAMAVALAGLLVGGAGALAAWHALDEAPSGSRAVRVTGPTGVLFDGLVHAATPTALTLLEATGLDVESESYPGMGTYVRAIEGHRAFGSSGWIYEIGREGAWEAGDRSAADRPVAEGAALRWRWVDG